MITTELHINGQLYFVEFSKLNINDFACKVLGSTFEVHAAYFDLTTRPTDISPKWLISSWIINICQQKLGEFFFQTKKVDKYNSTTEN